MLTIWRSQEQPQFKSPGIFLPVLPREQPSSYSSGRGSVTERVQAAIPGFSVVVSRKGSKNNSSASIYLDGHQQNQPFGASMSIESCDSFGTPKASTFSPGWEWQLRCLRADWNSAQVTRNRHMDFGVNPTAGSKELAYGRYVSPSRNSK